MSSRALPLLALLISVGIFFAYVRPTWQGPIAQTKAAIKVNDAALKAVADYKAKENELARQRSAIDAANLARLSVLLPDSVDNVSIILDINALAARSQLALTSINVSENSQPESKNPVSAAPQQAMPAGAAMPGVVPGAGAAVVPSSSRVNPLGSVDLSLSVVGTYAAFQTFLESLEKSARLLDVRELSVKGSDTGVYTYELTLRLYWLR